ncbi:hypothetical protein [Lactococcus lactis]|uniref:hypothetical protein n=1 Tax=Lactococcus lactis TaxID=1358 RepID=UPI002891E2A0|nr:hypothetical protein [Lactococcus lactis]MDT2909296.1 hypothetical protein [Lactococcus lactis]MDT2925174.1 hypothetical protein [Lactococcus lactis]MDT2952033.1 hypothetical protein [Lactococcus lactis]
MSKEYYEIRSFPNGTDNYENFKNDGYIAVQWSGIGDVRQLTENQIRHELELLEPFNPNGRKNITGYKTTISQRCAFFERLKQMKIGDIILVPTEKGKNLSIFEVSKTYYYDKQNIVNETAHRIGVIGKTRIPRNSLSKSLNASLNTRLTISKISREKFEEIDNLLLGITYSNDDFAFESIMRELKRSFYESNNDIIKKSLILTGFSLSEAFLSEKIRSEALKATPKENNYISKKIIEIGLKSIDESLKRHNDRIKSFKSVFETTKDISFPNQEQQNLRNKLAHDISSPYLEGDKIFFIKNENSEPTGIIVEEIFENFIKYPKIINQAKI